MQEGSLEVLAVDSRIEVTANTTRAPALLAEVKLMNWTLTHVITDEADGATLLTRIEVEV